MSRILLIEDDPLCASVVAGTLNRAGHSVVTRENAADALQALRTDLFGLVISDVMIPGGISGFDLVQSIRRNLRTCQLPVAFLTGLGNPEDVKRALACGVDDYMVKPADPDILVAKVTSLLDRSYDLGFDVARKEVHEAARIKLNIAITGISETGLTLVFPFAPEAGKKFHMSAQVLDHIGIGTTQMRIVSCHAHPTFPAKYIVDASFVGLFEGKLKMIRRWLNRNKEV